MLGLILLERYPGLRSEHPIKRPRRKSCLVQLLLGLPQACVVRDRLHRSLSQLHKGDG